MNEDLTNRKNHNIIAFGSVGNMKLLELEKNWNELGRQDPYWAILTDKSKRNSKWDIDEFYKTGQVQFNTIWHQITDLGLQLETQYALDFGCGVGRLTQAGCRYFDKVIGVDIAETMVDLAQKNNRWKDKCSYIVVKNNNLNLFPDNTFNFIISLLTLQHMKPEYSEKYLSEFIRILKPGGVIIFNHPSEIERYHHRISELFIKYVNKILNIFFHKPIMEMYGIRKEKVERIIHSNGGKLLLTKKSARSHWISYTYYVTK